MLTLRLVCVGRMKAGADRNLCDRYLERARLAGRALGLGVGLLETAESRTQQASARKQAEAVSIRALLGDKVSLLVAFDETGRSIDSKAFADILRTAVELGGSDAGLLIGGPDGLDPALRDDATHVVALGAMTWPHQLARIMVAEQIYRAVTILSGHPYHRV